jgi:hypothetical protein
MLCNLSLHALELLVKSVDNDVGMLGGLHRGKLKSQNFQCASRYHGIFETRRVFVN